MSEPGEGFAGALLPHFSGDKGASVKVRLETLARVSTDGGLHG
jgi:hypothetical protein